MSSGKSIDGLQRKKGVNNIKSVTKVSPTMKRRVVVKSTTTKKPVVKTVAKKKVVGLPEKKKDLKALIEEQEEMDSDNSVKEYLDGIKDIDSTDFVESRDSEDYDDDRAARKAAKKAAKKAQKSEKKKKKHIVRKIVLVLIVLLIGAGVWAYFYLNDFVAKVTDGGNLMGFIFSDPDTPLQKDANGRVNILLFGTEGWYADDQRYDGASLTDSMIVITIDQDSGDVKAISLPRDLKMDKPCTGTGKLNEAYWCKYSPALRKGTSADDKKKYEKEGSSNLAREAENITGLSIQYKVHVNWQAVVQVIDAIGGVDVVFTYGDQKWDGEEIAIKTTDKRGLAEIKWNYQGYDFKYDNGKVYHLNGKQALAVARARNARGGYGASGGNFSRETFQQRIIEAAIKKARSKNLASDIVAVMKIKDAVGDNIRTTFKDDEIKSALKLLDNANINKIDTVSLEEGNLLTTGMINNISYVLPRAGVGNYSQIQNYVKMKLAGEDFTEEKAELIVLNASGKYGAAANEKTDLEDGGYIIKSIGDAPDDLKDFDGVKIYQVNSKKTKTAKALKKFYNANIITKIPESLSKYECDFIILIGKK